MPEEHAKGRFREAFIIRSEVQHDDSNDEDETVKDTLIKNKLIRRTFTELNGWENGIDEFIRKYDEEGPIDDAKLKNEISELENELQVFMVAFFRSTESFSM